MDSLDKTLSSIPEEIANKLLSSNLQVTLKVPGDAVQANIGRDGQATYHYRSGTLSKAGDRLPESDPKARAISGFDLPANSLVSFGMANSKPVLLGGLRGESLMSVKEIQRLAEKLGVKAVPVIFQGRLDDLQKQTVREWCKMTPEQKKEKLGSTSFCRFIVTLLTGQDPVEIPLVRDLDGVIEGFVFQFSTDDKAYLSKVIDPKFKDSVEIDAVQGSGTELEEIARAFMDFFDRNGVILDGNDKDERLELNFRKALKHSPKTYNSLVQLASTCSNDSNNDLPSSSVSSEFSEEIERNDLIRRLFNIFLSIFGNSGCESLPDDMQKEANKYIAKINQ